MTKTLASAGPIGAPAAVRATRPGWRDPRLWIGVAIVAICVIAGARLLAGADDTVEVWALSADHAAGSVIDAGDLSAHRVRFADAGDLDDYFRAGDPLPAKLTLSRGVSAGELLPRAAVGAATGSKLTQLPVSVAPSGVPAGLSPGATVDVYVVGRPGVGVEPSSSGLSGASGSGRLAPVLAGVTVIDVAPDDVGDAVTLTLAVPADAVTAYFAGLERLDSPVVTVVGRP